MKKLVISKLFLYRYRFVIGYVILGISFIFLLLTMSLYVQWGLSDAEMDSAVSACGLSFDSPMDGDLVDLPYRLLQKITIRLFGLTPFAIKLPSVLVGFVLGLLLILLLNRWFKNNVSLLASCLVVLSTPFLFLAGSGTPLIMLVFWPTLLLWLGSKIQGEKRPRPMYSLLFALALLLAVFTPYMLYFALFCLGFVILQPHLRFVVKSLPKIPLILVGLVVLGGLTALVINIVNHPDTIMELLFARGFEMDSFLTNIRSGLTPVFMWSGTPESIFLAPLISMPILALALIGLLSTTKGFFASRNSIATLLIIFTLVITGFNPEAVIAFILPFAILIAHGIKYLLEKWYGLFPENPYARIAALIPLSFLFGMIIIPGLLQYVNGYRYNPNIASQFNYDLAIIRGELSNETLLVREHYDFYSLLENSSELTVLNELPNGSVGVDSIAVLHGTMDDNRYQLKRIIASPLRENSDIIYLYTVKEKNDGSDYGPNEVVEPAS